MHHQRRGWDGCFPIITIDNDGKTNALQPPFVTRFSIQRRRLEQWSKSWLNFLDMGNPKAPVGRHFQRGVSKVLSMDTTAELA